MRSLWKVFSSGLVVVLPILITIYVNKDQIVELDIDAETAMRLTLTGGMKK